MVMLPKRQKRQVERLPHKVQLTGQGDGHVATVVSSNSGTEYRILADGKTLLCPCTGFTNRRKCSHVDDYKAEVTASGTHGIGCLCGVCNPPVDPQP